MNFFDGGLIFNVVLAVVIYAVAVAIIVAVAKRLGNKKPVKIFAFVTVPFVIALGVIFVVDGGINAGDIPLEVVEVADAGNGLSRSQVAEISINLARKGMKGMTDFVANSEEDTETDDIPLEAAEATEVVETADTNDDFSEPQVVGISLGFRDITDDILVIMIENGEIPQDTTALHGRVNTTQTTYSML